MPSIAIPVSLRGQLLSGSGFSPASIFSNNEPGIWLDPSDLTTMYQDRAGSTAVTTPGQSVGLRLDKSKGLVLGSELRGGGSSSTIGTPSIPTSYNVTTGVGRVRRDDALNAGSVEILTPSTGFYFIDVEVPASSTGSIRLRTDNAIGGAIDNTPSAIAPGSRVRFRVRIVSSGVQKTAFYISCTANAETSDFIVHSVKELPGNHAVANSDAARGIYGIEPVGGRRNLLTYTEQFDNAVWAKGANVTISSTSVTAPDGTATADRFSVSGSADVSGNRIFQSPTTSSGDFVFSVWLRSATSQTVRIKILGTTGAVVGATLDAAVTSTWTRFQIAATGLTANAGATIGVNGATTLTDVEIWGAQLETGSTATTYQRVTTQYDVTEAGKQTLHYVQYDGSDDGYVTPTITPGIDKVQVFAGVRKLSDALAGVLLELSATSASNNGSFTLSAPFTSVNAGYGFGSRGTTRVVAEATTGFAAPITNVITGIGDIAGDVSRLRANGAQIAADTTTDQGTGNYLAYPLYIGRRGGTTLPFNGRDYGIITRFGANLDASTIAATESWLNQKTGAY